MTSIFPVEVLELILEDIALISRDIKHQRYSAKAGISALAAFGLTCHAMSNVARAHLFRRVEISSEQRANGLISILSANDQISTLIKEVAITTGIDDDGLQDRPAFGHSSMATWLGTTIGRTLARKLQDARVLDLSHISPGRSEPNFIYSEEEDDVLDDSGKEYSQAWNNLRHLPSIVHLSLLECQVPSWLILGDLLTHFFPVLQSLSLRNVDMTNPDIPDIGSFIPISDFRHLETLSVSSYNEEAVFLFVSRMCCSNLKSLCLGPHFYLQHALENYADPVLASAIALERLILDGSCWNPHIIDLSNNINLQHLTFNDVGTMDNQAWIPEAITSLTDPTRIKTIEISGLLNSVQGAIWEAIDDVLSAPKFRCNFGKRILVLKNLTRTLNDLTKARLPKTQRLGWFNISWCEKE